MKNHLVVALLFSSSLVSAQVPGFMGKRFAIFLEANPTPALFVQNSNNQVVVNPGEDNARTNDVNRFAFTFRPQVTFEYLIHRDISVGLSYSQISIGTTRAYITDPLQDKNFSIDQDVVKGQSAGLHLKVYQFDNSASIAPIGFYQTYSVYVTKTNTYDTNQSSKAQFKNDFVYPVASLGIGRQSMIAKNLLLKTGVELGWAFVPTNWATESSSDWSIQEYAGYNVHRSLFGHYVFSINVAIGYIPF
jgi:hypothetical protein